MLNLEKKYAVDLEAAKDGVWHKLDDEISILVAKAGNENFKKKSFELFNEKRIETFSRTGKFEESDSQKLMAQLIAETILLDWKGVKDQDGKEVKYTSKLGAEIFLNPELSDFLNSVEECANDSEAYNKAVLAEIEKQAKK